MPNNNLEIVINLSGANQVSAQLRNVNNSLSNLQNTSSQASSQTEQLGASFASTVKKIALVGGSVTLLTSQLKSFIQQGIELNRAIESQTLGIGALINANTTLVTKSGEVVNSFDRFLLAGEKARETLLKIKKASVETVATFPQLTEIFNQAIGGTLSAGKSMGETTEEIIDNTIKIAQRITNIAGSIGMPMRMVNEEIRSIINGTITMNSTIAKMLHKTNADINKAKKEVGGLITYLNEKLSDFDVLQTETTFDKVVARITDSLDTIRLEATKPLFDDLYSQLIDLEEFFRENKTEIIYTIKIGYEVVSDTGSAIKDILSAGKNLVEIAGEGLLSGANTLANAVTFGQIDALQENQRRLNKAIQQDSAEFLRAASFTNLRLKKALETMLDFKDLKLDSLGSVEMAFSRLANSYKVLTKKFTDPKSRKEIDKAFDKMNQYLIKKAKLLRLQNKTSGLKMRDKAIPEEEIEKAQKKSLKYLEVSNDYEKAWELKKKNIIRDVKNINKTLGKDFLDTKTI